MKKLLFLLMFGVIFLMGITSAVLTDGLAGYYSLDDASGTNVKDNTTSSIHNGTATNLNSLAWKTGANCKVGGCIDLLGANDSVFIGTAWNNGYNDYNNYGNNMTLNFWAKVPAYDADSATTSKGLLGSTRGQWQFTIDNTPRIIIFMNNTGASFIRSGGTGLNEWHMYTYTYNGANQSLYVDGLLNTSKLYTDVVTPEDSAIFLGLYWEYATGSQNANVTLDEYGYWNRTITQSEVTSLYNSGSGLAYPLPTSAFGVTTTLDSPTNNTNITNNNVFNATITASGFNLINATFVSWYSNGTTFKTSIQNISGLSSNLTSFNISSFPIINGIFWNVLGVQGNGNGTNSSFATANFTNNIVKMIEINQTYTTPELGGSTSTFQIIIDTSRGYVPLLTYLVYNGTVNQGSFTVSGNRYTFTKILTVPFVTTQQNVSFYWNNSINDSTKFTSLTKYQILNNLSIDNCGANVHQIFNFTMYDEEYPLAQMTNTTIDYAFNIYNLNRDSLLLSLNASSSTNPTRICLNSPLTDASNYSLDGNLKYHGNETFAIRYYNFLNFTLTNSTVSRSISLYNVNESNSLPFLLTFRDSTSALAPNVLIYVNKQYTPTNDFKTVELPITDTNGQTILNLIRNTGVYNFIMLDITGTVLASFNNVRAFCQDYTIGSCAIELSAPGSGQVSYNYNSDVGISYALAYSNSTKLISLAFNSLNSTTQNVRMLVTTENQFENVTICDTSLITTTGTLSCDITDDIDTNQYFFVSIYSNGNLIETQIINANINLGSIGTAFGINGFFIALLIILVIILLFADDKQTLIIMLGIGWVTVGAFGLIRGALLGITSGGIWLIITLFIFIWKLKKEEVG